MSLRTRLALTVALTAIPLVAGLAWLRSDLERRGVEDGLREFAVAHMEAGGRERCEEAPERFGGRLGRDGRRGPRGPGGRGRRPDDRPRPPPPGPPEAGSGFEPPPRPGGPPPFGDARRPGPRGGPRPPPDGPRRPPSFELWAYDSAFMSANPDAPALPEELRGDLEGGDDLAGAPFAADGREGYQVAVRTRWADGPCAVVLLRRFGGGPPSVVGDLLRGAAVLCVVLLLAVVLAAGPIVQRIRRLTSQVRQSASSRYAQAVEVRGRDEIARLARAFNDAGGELRRHLETIERRERTLRDFVANTSHDVMLPLTVLQGHLSAMRRRLGREEEIDAPLVRDALEEAHYMGSLLHNLSAVAKLEAGEESVNAHPVDMNALVERAVSRHAAMARAKDVELNHAVPESPLRALGDVTLIEQAVSNVVHNAVRYNERGGHVAVLLEAQDGRFSLRVVDDGPGIPEDQLAQLPERRFRGQRARTRHPEGLGLGLHITRDVAARHGFDLALRRSSYGGLEVVLSGPLEGAES